MNVAIDGACAERVARRYGGCGSSAFPAAEFRLWVALHECTHGAQFAAVGWLRGYFHAQVQGFESVRRGGAVHHHRRGPRRTHVV